MGIMALTGLMLGTISYETMEDYHTSTQSVAGLYAFNDALDEWETVLEDYVVNSTEIARQACLDAWIEVGTRLDMVDMREAEAFQLAEENLSAVYSHTDEEMRRLLLAENGAARTEAYAQLVRGRRGCASSRTSFCGSTRTTPCGSIRTSCPSTCSPSSSLC